MSSTQSFLDLATKKAKNLFLSWQYQSLNVTEIKLHDLSISSTNHKVSDSHTKLKALLDAPEFWEALNEQMGFSKEISDLKSQWESAKKFAGFKAPELMQFKWNKLDPYEVTILRSLEALENDSKRYELNGFWRPKWMLKWHQEKIDALNSKHQEFLELKKELQLNLLLKTQLYVLLGVSKYVDDVYLYFATKIGQLNVVHPQILSSTTISATLDDDTRIAIYDYLSCDAPEGSDDLEVIIVPTSHVPYNVPAKPKQVNKEQKHINVFVAKIESRLQLSSVAKFKKEKLDSDNTESWQNKWIVSPLSRLVASNHITHRIKRIWRYRWGLALIASLGFYFWLASIAVTFVGLTLGAWAASMASNALFYGFALLPAYIMGYKALATVGNVVHNIFSYWKTREIYQSLELLKLNQRFIVSQLSSGIRDVAFFNIASLESNAQSVLKNIDKTIETLKSVKGITKLVYWGTFKQSNLGVIAELKLQKQVIAQLLALFLILALPYPHFYPALHHP